MVYGKVNLHKLIKKYPQYAYHLGGNWLRSWYGYLIFNDYIIKLIDYLLINNNAKILIKYKIVYSVIKGYRLGLKKEG